MVKYPKEIRDSIIGAILLNMWACAKRGIIEEIPSKILIPELQNMSQRRLTEQYYQWKLMLNMAKANEFTAEVQNTDGTFVMNVDKMDIPPTNQLQGLETSKIRKKRSNIISLVDALKAYTWHKNNCVKCNCESNVRAFPNMCDIGVAMFKRYLSLRGDIVR